MQKLTGEASIQQLEGELVKYFTDQGYQVTRGVRLRGKSGIEHTFNLLARLDDGFASYSVAFLISRDNGIWLKRIICANIMAFLLCLTGLHSDALFIIRVVSKCIR